jgi:hypothetical protein
MPVTPKPSSMRHLNIQLQPERAPKLKTDEAKRIIEALTADHSIVAGYRSNSGDDDGAYVNFTFLAKDLPKLWARVKAEVLADPQLGRDISRATIIMCEGQSGWDDYLLLHHYDGTLELDGLDEG